MKMKKTKIAVTIAVATMGLVMMSFDVMDDTGKAGRTGSPGESTCTGCHTGSPLNDGTGSVVISSPDLGTTWEYMTGDTYTINVTVSRLGNPLFGFGFESLTGTTPAQNAGTLLVTNSSTHILSATVSTVSRKNMVHTFNGGVAQDSKTFTFKWIAPTTNVGNVTFYCTGNAADASTTKFGDHIYSTTQVVTPAFGAGISDNPVTKGDFSVFPNPASENIFVNYNCPLGQQVDFTLLTLDGKSVGAPFTFDGTGAATTSALNLPSDLAKGVYLLRMETASEIRIHKVIVE